MVALVLHILARFDLVLPVLTLVLPVSYTAGNSLLMSTTLPLPFVSLISCTLPQDSGTSPRSGAGTSVSSGAGGVGGVRGVLAVVSVVSVGSVSSVGSVDGAAGSGTDVGACSGRVLSGGGSEWSEWLAVPVRTCSAVV